MKKYQITLPFCGYLRGFDTYEVEAASREDAVDMVEEGDIESTDRQVVRDDREHFWEDMEIEEVKDE